MSESTARRELHFGSLEEALADAESLAQGPVTTSGAYSFGQILDHLARTIEVVAGDRESPRISFPIRLVARMLRSRFVTKGMKPGFKLPSKAQSVFWPDGEVETTAGLEHYRESIELFKRTDPLPPHPIFGEMSRADQEQLQCRHAELHLSFVHRAS